MNLTLMDYPHRFVKWDEPIQYIAVIILTNALAIAVNLADKFIYISAC